METLQGGIAVGAARLRHVTRRRAGDVVAVDGGTTVEGGDA